jgi:hypothetical protein
MMLSIPRNAAIDTWLFAAHNPAAYGTGGIFQLVGRGSTLMPKPRTRKRFCSSQNDYADVAFVLAYVHYLEIFRKKQFALSSWAHTLPYTPGHYPASVLSSERGLARPRNFYIQPGAVREEDWVLFEMSLMIKYLKTTSILIVSSSSPTSIKSQITSVPCFL